jgi:hypothetical protein
MNPTIPRDAMARRTGERKVFDLVSMTGLSRR